MSVRYIIEEKIVEAFEEWKEPEVEFYPLAHNEVGERVKHRTEEEIEDVEKLLDDLLWEIERSMISKIEAKLERDYGFTLRT